MEIGAEEPRMVGVVEIGIWIVLACLLELPVFWAWMLIWVYVRNEKRAVISSYHPRACVILCLRGTDPFLKDCLTGLLHQDYPAYRARIIIDSETDPAWDVVHQRLAQGYPAHVEVEVEALREPKQTCSLKVSSILQGLAGLDEKVEVVALIDADVIASRTWLRTLVAPLQDPRVGVASGLRWYAPRENAWGTLVRYLWNAGAITQMNAFGVAWGGSLALHARIFRHPTAIERWSHSFCEDTGMSGLVRDLGQQLRFVTEATMVNQESIDLSNCCTFIRRQLFCARMHHVRWPLLAWANRAVALSQIAAVALLMVGLWTQMTAWVVGMTILLGFYVFGLFFAGIALDRCIRKVVH